MDRLVTLGTPNTPPPKGTVDQTRGLLTYVERECDVADIVNDLVCVAGKGTVGRPIGKGSLGEYVAFLSYAAVCGRGDVDGDGVTPVDAACAKGGTLLVCDQCDHSMLTSEQWYGSEKAFNVWAPLLR